MSKMLDQALEEYAASDVYPFHMPGHKRHNMGIADPYQIDITEIYGFDNLHDPQGIIGEAHAQLSGLYGSRCSYFLINGSTCGNLAAVFAAVRQGEELLIGRNAHRSVYHAAILRRVRLRYLYPASAAGNVLQGEIRPQDVRQALERYPAVKAVLLTSPTYEGVVCDIKEIAEICHAHGVLLIVDAAHGAHLGFHPYFPESPVKLGADLVVMSLHKTLPSLTQTAVLHLQGELIERDVCEKYLRMFQSSSPSYLLMAGMVKCVRYLEEKGKEAFGCFADNLERFYKNTSDLEHLRIWNPGTDKTQEKIFARDPSKIVILTERCGITGEQLSRRLRQEFALELEMSASDYALAMTSMMDSREGFDRLSAALHRIDAFPEAEKTGKGNIPKEQEETLLPQWDVKHPEAEEAVSIMELWEAEEAKSVLTPLEKSEGHVAAEFVAVYPPGIPVLVPGECVTKRQVERLRRSLAHQLTVQGLLQKKGTFFIKTVAPTQ